MIQLIGFIQDKILYIRARRTYSDKLEGYLVNGKKLKKTFDEYWFKASGLKLNTLSKPRSKQINHRLVLNTPELKDYHKIVFVKDCEPNYGDDGDGYKILLDFQYKGKEYKGRFYNTECDYETYYEQLEFQIDMLINHVVFKEYEHPHQLPEFMLPRKHNNELVHNMRDTNALISLDLILYDRDILISTPKPLLASKPCKLTRKYSYDIVRGYIKKHIDKNYAYISSDYDFCLTVQKILKLQESETHEMFGLFDGKPKGKKKFIDKKVEIFKTSPPEKNGKPRDGYPLIEPFKGDNINDLFSIVEKYLKDLMLIINEPLKECSHCKGTGAEPELKSLQAGK